MKYFSSLSFGYKIMVVGIIIFIVGVIIMMFENRKDRRSAKKIKTDYLVKNNVRIADNPVANAPANVNVASNINTSKPEENQTTQNAQPNNSEMSNKNAEEFMNMFK